MAGRPSAAPVAPATLAALLAAGCGLGARSEGQIKDEFRAFVDRNSACAAAEDCALVSPGCPLGCWVAVRRDRAEATEAQARSLITAYERGGRACMYGCIAPPAASCAGGRCALADAGAAAAPGPAVDGGAPGR